MARKYNYCCSTCGTRLQKRGLTAAGTQRWYCVTCRTSSVKTRPDLKNKLLLERFVKWILSKESQKELAERRKEYTERTWRRSTAWCWNVVPKPIPELIKQINCPIVILDGIKVGSVVNHIAITKENVINWRWDTWECSRSWEAVLYQISQPQVVVTDGQKGVLLAISHCWPKARVQRCIFHVWQNIRVKLTLNPKTEAGIELLNHARVLLRGIYSMEDRDIWIEQLLKFGKKHNELLNAKTYNPDPYSSHRWWYTHRGLRSAYRQLVKLVESGQLFTYLDVSVTDYTTGEMLTIPRTTNNIEGGINSQLRTTLKLHRGMPNIHQLRLVEWYLYTKHTTMKQRIAVQNGVVVGQKPPRNVL